TPSGAPQDSWRPVITGVSNNGDGTFTLFGTQLNGISEGASYGDDFESSTNYPIVQFTDAGGNVYYGRTFNWSSTGVATGSSVVSTQFTLPPGHAVSDFVSITVIANGIPSESIPFAPRTPGLSTWDGGGADNNWSTAANWVGDVAPHAGDDLVFPSG